MKRRYQKVSNAPVALVPEGAILTSSIIEVDTAVSVEDFHEGFDSTTFGDEGFEVVFE